MIFLCELGSVKYFNPNKRVWGSFLFCNYFRVKKNCVRVVCLTVLGCNKESKKCEIEELRILGEVGCLGSM